MRLMPAIAALSLFACVASADETAVPVEPTVPATDAAAITEPVAPETPAPVTPDDPAPPTEPAPPPAPTFVVFLPEQVDTEWLWYYPSDSSPHIVQGQVEKALINAGFDVIDLGSIQQLKDGGAIQDFTAVPEARAAAQAVNATYAIVGTATAVRGSLSSAYGVNVVRSSAEISAKIVRVADGKIVAVEDASAQSGGQAARAAGQAALKDAGAALARKLSSAAKRLAAQP